MIALAAAVAALAAVLIGVFQAATYIRITTTAASPEPVSMLGLIGSGLAAVAVVLVAIVVAGLAQPRRGPS